MFGYHGRYLRVDLCRGRTEWIALPEDVLRRFIGGVGLATYLMHRECPAGVDPLAPEAPLIFCLSPLVGTPLTTSAKFAVVAKSPLTQRLNDALSSSHFAIAAKKAGLDALVITGACSEPSTLIIRDGEMALESAADLWGLLPPETEARLAERLGPQFQMAVIGPAGENLVRFATISHDNRHAGRGGLGAVMGSKKLKAVAVAGSQLVGQGFVETILWSGHRQVSRAGNGRQPIDLQSIGGFADPEFSTKHFCRSGQLGEWWSGE